MMVKKFLLKLYYFPYRSKDKIDQTQKEVRDVEWDSIKPYIKKGGQFLDVGCGTGDNMKRAKQEFGCDVHGIDPSPGAHGVGRYSDQTGEIQSMDIRQGGAESLPFESGSMDVVFCSHVLEHVNDTKKSLQEMKRVLKDDGTLIIGMPTAAMAWIGLISNLFFTTHMRWVNVLFKPFIKTGKAYWFHLFLPSSHSYPNRSIIYDLRNYRVSQWKSLISTTFIIKQVLLPLLYPFPEFIQWFSPYKSTKLSSSVFLICDQKPSSNAK